MTIMSPVINILRSDSGNRNFQPKCINWSYLSLGKVDLIQIKKNKQPDNFNMNHTTGGKNGPCHPPRKKVTAIADTVIMLAYSAMKNMANFILLYSVWYPATSSDSASGRSNGQRLTSAIALVK
jgi:hypothetical protein